MDNPKAPGERAGVNKTQVVVATTVMLSFISFWRAAAIVLNDLASSAYYCAGIAEQAVGKAAPWFIFGVMLFSYAVRSVYVESCAMFTRGGVYRVVKEAMGGTLAKLSVSALMFDYILTGPISGVSAGQYIIGLAAQTANYFGHPWHPTADTINMLAACIALVVTVYFWWRNTLGIHESSSDALRIMAIATVMVVVLMVWGCWTLAVKPETRKLPPAPVPANLHLAKDAVGWLPQMTGDALVKEPATGGEEEHYHFKEHLGGILGLIGIIMAFGHSFLAMSGEESLAQVNRELEHPKHKNLMRAGMVIFVYSLVLTSMVSFFAHAMIPDSVRPHYYDNLISGISMYLAGPTSAKLLFQAFIVFVGFLMLAGAINTAIVGSNGVLNRVSEDGVMPDWLRAPHRKYGTTYRMINLIVALQLIAIIGSRGNTYMLGEAYAFGVVWSFAFKGLAMLVLRFKDRTHREWKVPGNIPLGGGREIPLVLGLIALALFAVAIVNLVTKQVATISGTAFTVVFFILFASSERIMERKRTAAHVEMDQFSLAPRETVSTGSMGIRPANSLCYVRDYNSLDHLGRALDAFDTTKHDMVVMTTQLTSGPGYQGLSTSQLFTQNEQLLFSRVVAVAEKAGKHVKLLVVPALDPDQAIAQTAVLLGSTEVIAAPSPLIRPEEQAKRLGQAWERLADRAPQEVRYRIIAAAGQVSEFSLGAHAPDLPPEDVGLIHDLWLELVQSQYLSGIHHRDVVTLALRRLQNGLSGTERRSVMDQMRALATGAGIVDIRDADVPRARGVDLVVGVLDGGGDADAVRFAAQIARTAGGTVHIVGTAVMPRQLPLSAPAAGPERVIAAKLGSLALLPRSMEVPVICRVERTREPAWCLVQVATAIGASKLILGLPAVVSDELSGIVDMITARATCEVVVLRQPPSVDGDAAPAKSNGQLG